MEKIIMNECLSASGKRKFKLQTKDSEQEDHLIAASQQKPQNCKLYPTWLR